MTVKEQIARTLEGLTESELHEVAEYLSFLRFRFLLKIRPSVDEEKIRTLYAEFADEDLRLAEEGLEEYAADLRDEDAQ